MLNISGLSARSAPRLHGREGGPFSQYTWIPTQRARRVNRNDVVLHVRFCHIILHGVGRAIRQRIRRAARRIAPQHGSRAVEGGATSVEAANLAVLLPGGGTGRVAHIRAVNFAVQGGQHMAHDKRFFHNSAPLSSGPGPAPRQSLLIHCLPRHFGTEIGCSR